MQEDLIHVYHQVRCTRDVARSIHAVPDYVQPSTSSSHHFPIIRNHIVLMHTCDYQSRSQMCGMMIVLKLSSRLRGNGNGYSHVSYVVQTASFR
jgi:hypothetical protein